MGESGMSKKMRARKQTSNETRRKIPQRPERPGYRRGRCQLGAISAAYALGDTLSTSDVALFAYANRILMRGQQLEPHHYRTIRHALELIGSPIGRGPGRGRPMRWRIDRRNIHAT
jgi:hypothetical protein